MPPTFQVSLPSTLKSLTTRESEGVTETMSRWVGGQHLCPLTRNNKSKLTLNVTSQSFTSVIQLGESLPLLRFMAAQCCHWLLCNQLKSSHQSELSHKHKCVKSRPETHPFINVRNTCSMFPVPLFYLLYVFIGFVFVFSFSLLGQSQVISERGRSYWLVYKCRCARMSLQTVKAWPCIARSIYTRCTSALEEVEVIQQHVRGVCL